MDGAPWIVRTAAGYVVSNCSTTGIVDGDTGRLEGRAIEIGAIDAGQIVGDEAWVPTMDLMRLGTRAPRIIDLRSAPTPEVRDAVAVDLQPIPVDAPLASTREHAREEHP